MLNKVLELMNSDLKLYPWQGCDESKQIAIGVAGLLHEGELVKLIHRFAKLKTHSKIGFGKAALSRRATALLR